MEFVAVAILPVHKGRPTKGEKWAFRLARRTDRYSDSNVTAPISTLRSQNPALKNDARCYGPADRQKAV